MGAQPKGRVKVSSDSKDVLQEVSPEDIMEFVEDRLAERGYTVKDLSIKKGYFRNTVLYAIRHMGHPDRNWNLRQDIAQYAGYDSWYDLQCAVFKVEK